MKLVLSDRYQPNAPRFRVVVVIIMVVIIMPRGIAALESARLPVLVSRLSMGSQKCTDDRVRSTCKGAAEKISLLSWQMGYNSEVGDSPSFEGLSALGIPSGPDLSASPYLILERS